MSKDIRKIKIDNGPLGFIFCMAWIGALIYFVQQSEGFGGFLLAVLKSIVWPAYLVHGALSLLGA